MPVNQRVGSLVFATEQGLGYLAKSFYDAQIVTDVMVVAHGRRKEYEWEWYPKAQKVHSLSAPTETARLKEFCRSVDTMLFFETPFVWDLIPYCKSIGVKTVLMPMYECMPKELPAIPNVILCPSLLDYQYYLRYDSLNCRVVNVTVPVDKVEYRQRERAKVFVHNAGWGGLKGRNGTKEFIEALQHVKSPARFLIRSQNGPLNHESHQVLTNPDITIQWAGTIPREELYREGDVFVFPEKFNGLSLPLQEAHASGMLVMTTARFPNTIWLPQSPLIPVSRYETSSVHPRMNETKEAIVEPLAIAQTIDDWYDKDITSYSEQGKAWGQANSWAALAPVYRRELRNERCS